MLVKTQVRLTLSPLSAVLAGVLVTLIAVLWSWRLTQSFSQAPFMLCPGLALTGMLLMGSDQVLERFQRWIHLNRSRIILVPAGLWLLYVIYAAGMGIASAAAAITMSIYLGVPFVCLWLSRRVEPQVILWIWLPLEFGLIRRILLTGAAGGDIHYAFGQLLAVDAAIVAFAVWNRTPNIGYRFEWDAEILRGGFANFLMFSAIAVPLGLAIGFIHYSFTASKLYLAVPVFAGVFLFTALPEEFLFRGLIQNWMERVTKNPLASLIVASLIFGVSHLNNGPPIPNYRYFLMATIAGVFYGRAWRNTGSLMASSLTHALVNTFWSVFFR